MATDYPKEFKVIQRKNKTLGFEAFLNLAKSSDGKKPLTVYGDFSRFSLSLIDKSTNTNRIGVGNIRINELADIEFNTEYAAKAHMDFLRSNGVGNSNPDSNQSLAYTVKIAMGKLKGKTPAQCIAEGNKQELTEQLSFLKQNISKYPNNQSQIDAIYDAAKLYKEGKINQGATVQTTSNVINIYEVKMLSLASRKRADGKCLGYDIKVDWVLGNNYPVNLTITNYYGQRLQNNNGGITFQNIDAGSRFSVSLAMSKMEWLDVVKDMHDLNEAFKNGYAKQYFEDAENAYEQARNAYKQKNDDNYPKRQVENNYQLQYQQKYQQPQQPVYVVQPQYVEQAPQQPKVTEVPEYVNNPSDVYNDGLDISREDLPF